MESLYTDQLVDGIKVTGNEKSVLLFSGSKSGNIDFDIDKINININQIVLVRRATDVEIEHYKTHGY